MAKTATASKSAGARSALQPSAPSKPVESEKERTDRQLRKLAERNPEFFRHLQNQNLISSKITVNSLSNASGLSDGMELTGDDANAAYYAKKLGIKDGKINASFKRDGLDFLLDGINLDVSGRSKKRVGSDSDDDGDEDEQDNLDDFGGLGGDDDEDDDDDDDEDEDEDDEDMNDMDMGGLDDSDNGIQDSEDEDMLDMDDDDEEDEDDEDEEEDEEDEDDEDDVEDEDDGKQAKPAAPAPVSGKYVPPHLRKLAETKSEQYMRLKRQLQGLLNRLSDANLESIVIGIESALGSNSRHDVTEIITDIIISYIGENANMLESFIATYASMVAALHNTIGLDFGAHFVQKLMEQFEASRNQFLDAAETADQEARKNELETVNKRCSNFATMLAMLYNFQVVSCVLIYDVVRLAMASLNELDVEVLLRILRFSGHQLRSDDPASLKDIVLLVKEATGKVDQTKISMRVKFMVETIMDLKNNKRKQNDSNAANHIQQDRIKKAIAGIVKKRSLYGVEPLRVSLDDIRSVDTKGKWWIVGAAWAGHNGDGTSSKRGADGAGDTVSSATKDASQQLLELARKHKMNTDVRRSIFVVLMSSEDCLDAFERLLKLNLKDKQEREIVRVIMHCCVQEKVYNPYYALVAEQFCKHSHGFKITLQFALWDALKAMGGDDSSRGYLDDGEGGSEYAGKDGLRRISNLAKLYCHLINNESLALMILKSTNFAMLSQMQILFFRLLFANLMTTPVVKASSSSQASDIKFVKLFQRLKAQHELAGLCEGLLLFFQMHIAPQLKAGQILLLGIKDQDVDLYKRRVKTIKQILA
ncbi:hypothetical protein BC831DRAFT_150045 [Entophlyctis helioformis]|nr:hypothetical protein BC831DRAFT_150045 [Entophlyctis helioformis]